MFDLFAQAQTGLDRAKGGLGIGLSLAQRLTELHGGSIRVQSKGLGHGAEFVVTLPRAAALAPVAERIADDAPATTGPGTLTRVLLVDDNGDATHALALLLDQAGFAVVTAHDGGEALERAAEMQPDIVLLDLGLPVVDGYRVAETLRARAGGEVPLLVAISGYGQTRRSPEVEGRRLRPSPRQAYRLRRVDRADARRHGQLRVGPSLFVKPVAPSHVRLSTTV